MKKADLIRHCIDNRLRLTKPRELVFDLLRKYKQPVTAYEMLSEMSRHMDKAQPPTAYRALGFLVDEGFAHRIESINAYLFNHGPILYKDTQFFICKECGYVECFGVYTVNDRLFYDLETAGHEISGGALEVHGTCNKCVKERENND